MTGFVTMAGGASRVILPCHLIARFSGGRARPGRTIPNGVDEWFADVVEGHMLQKRGAKTV